MGGVGKAKFSSGIEATSWETIAFDDPLGIGLFKSKFRGDGGAKAGIFASSQISGDGGAEAGLFESATISVVSVLFISLQLPNIFSVRLRDLFRCSFFESVPFSSFVE